MDKFDERDLSPACAGTGVRKELKDSSTTVDKSQPRRPRILEFRRGFIG
jgi:hypothetical protein